MAVLGGLTVGIVTGIGLENWVIWTLFGCSLVSVVWCVIRSFRGLTGIAFDATFVTLTLTVCFMVLRRWYLQLALSGLVYVIVITACVMIAMMVGVRRTLKQDKRSSHLSSEHRHL